MTRRILQSALLSLSLSLTGCAVYEVDHRGYSAPRYPSYGYQQPVYPRTYYQQYPRVQEYRYPRAPVVQGVPEPPQALPVARVQAVVEPPWAQVWASVSPPVWAWALAPAWRPVHRPPVAVGVAQPRAA